MVYFILLLTFGPNKLPCWLSILRGLRMSANGLMGLHVEEMDLVVLLPTLIV